MNKNSYIMGALNEIFESDLSGKVKFKFFKRVIKDLENIVISEQYPSLDSSKKTLKNLHPLTSLELYRITRRLLKYIET